MKKFLSFVSTFNTAKLLWIPGNCGVEGNGISNALAREGFISPMSGAEPAIRLSVALTKAAIRDWEQVFNKNKWQSLGTPTFSRFSKF